MRERRTANVLPVMGALCILFFASPVLGAWTVDRSGSLYRIAADPAGMLPVFSVVTDGALAPMATRDGGFLRFAKPCPRVTLRAHVTSVEGAAIVVDEGNVHHASFNGRSVLKSAGVQRFSWISLPQTDEPHAVELDVEPPASTCVLRVRLPGTAQYVDRPHLDAIAKTELFPSDLQFDSMSMLPEVRTKNATDFLLRSGDRHVFQWPGGPEFLFDQPSQTLALIDDSRRVNLARLPERSRGLVAGTTLLLRERLTELLQTPSHDPGLVRVFSEDLRRILAPIARGEDPLDTMEGPARLGLTSPVDGRAQELAFYMPPLPRASVRRYPLVVALHGLDGHAMNYLRAVLGEYATGLDGVARDRLPGKKQGLNAFVVAPAAHGNAMYRGIGEQAVLDAIDAIVARFPIDPDRITITGASMGGTGAAAIALRHPHRFAGAMPLCGYHSYFIRRDFNGLTLLPWEEQTSQLRSPALQAANGIALPMRLVHGTQDLPLENGKVLVDAYARLDQSMVFDQPKAGHDVWTWAFNDGHGLDWLLAQRRAPTSTFRYVGNDVKTAFSHGFRVTSATEPGGWFEMSGTEERGRVRLQTRGVEALSVSPTLLPPKTKEVVVDRQRIPIEKPRAALHLESRNGAWHRAKAPASAPQVLRFRDIFSASLRVMVTDSPTARMVAGSFVPHRPFVDVAFPSGPLAELPAGHIMTLVVGASTDPLVRQLLASEHIIFSPAELRLGGRVVPRDDLSLAVVIPGKRLAFITGASDSALARNLALPDILPTLVVGDDGVAADGHPIVAGRRKYVLAGDAATLLRLKK